MQALNERGSMRDFTFFQTTKLSLHSLFHEIISSSRGSFNDPRQREREKKNISKIFNNLRMFAKPLELDLKILISILAFLSSCETITLLSVCEKRKPLHVNETIAKISNSKTFIIIFALIKKQHETLIILFHAIQ